MTRREMNGTVIAVGIAVAGGMFTLGVWYGDLNADLESIKDGQESISLTIKETSDATQRQISETGDATQRQISETGKATQWQISETGRATRESLSRIEASIDRIGFSGALHTSGDHSVERSSPLKLTELGHKISAEMGGRELAEDLAREFAPQVAGMIPYDVQQFAIFHFMDEALNDAEFRKRARNVAYANSVSELSVIRVLGIELRDALLETASP